MNTVSYCKRCFKNIMASGIIPFTYYTIILIFISLLTILFISWLEPKIWGFFGSLDHSHDIVIFKKGADWPLSHLHDAFLILLTALIAVIAWVELKGLYKNSMADMLLRIDRSLRNPEALKAMKIIRQFRFEAMKEIQNQKKDDFSNTKKLL
jgi:hypothetical protein